MNQKPTLKTGVRRTLALVLCLSMLLSLGSTLVLAQQPEGKPSVNAEGGPPTGTGEKKPTENKVGSQDPGTQLEKEGPAALTPDTEEGGPKGPDSVIPGRDPDDPDLSPSREPGDQEPKEKDTKVTSLRKTLSSPPAKACPNHPEHDETCGFRPATPEVPCDKGCTDQDGDGQIDHAPDCAYKPAQPGSPCTHSCEFCHPTPVTVTAQLPETIQPGQSLDLMEGTQFTPAEDTDGNAVSLEIVLSDSQGLPIPLEGHLWTPTEVGAYQVTYTAVKTIADQQVPCGTLSRSLTVTAPEAAQPTVLQQLFESRHQADSLALMLTGLLPEGRSFSQDQLAALIEAQTQEDFETRFRQALSSLLSTEKVITDEQYEALSAETDIDRFQEMLAQLLAPPADLPQSVPVTGAPDVALTWEGSLPQGITLAAEALESQDPHILLSLNLQLTGEDGEPITEPLDPPVSMTIHSDRITGPGQHLYYVGPPQIQLFSELPVEAQIREGSLTFPLENPGVYALKADYVITPDLPEKTFVDTQLEPLKNIQVSPALHEGQPIEVRVKSIRLLGNDSISWLPQQYFTPNRPGTWVILYEAYVGDTVLAQYSYHLLVESNRQVGELLDGDYAYIESTGMVQEATASGFRPTMRTGSAPWDETEGRGNDTTPLDNIVRSFDIVTYTVFFQSKVRNDSPCSAYKTGRLFFEFILPGEKEQVQFEIESMGWLLSKNASYTIEELTFQGKPAQVLRGSYLWVPSEDNPTAIGESYQELNVALRTLNMVEGSTVQPHCSFWLQYNDVGCSYNEEGTIPTGAPITGTAKICPTHGDAELRSFSCPEVRVTSQLRLNVNLEKGHAELNQSLGTFDFNTGDPDTAPNYGIGQVEGRIIGYGLVLQVVGKGAGHGLRGCQFPDGNPITLDVDLTSQFRGDSGNLHPIDGYEPILWSVSANDSSNITPEGRSLSQVGNPQCTFSPANSRNDTNRDYCACIDGGSWAGTVNSETGKISITVTDYQFDLNDAIPFPYVWLQSTPEDYSYYNPKAVSNFWEIPVACFSVGKLWVVQPFYNAEDEYVALKYEPGTFQVTTTDTNLMATCVDHTGSVSSLPHDAGNQNQVVTTDDQKVFTCYLTNPGTHSPAIIYTPAGAFRWNEALTEGCWTNGEDWILNGSPLSIYSLIHIQSAEREYATVAHDHLVKFDDRFFQINDLWISTATGKGLYGAKKDGSGWDHKGLQPSEPGYDLEMMQATADDLVFYSSLEELKADGKVCVAALMEGREVNSTSLFSPSVIVYGKCKNDPSLNNNVFMATTSYRIWQKRDIEHLVRDYLSKPDGELTDSDYQKYVTEKMTSRADVTDTPMQYSDYIEQPSILYEYDNISGLQTYSKARYDATGFLGATGGFHFGDSCLVVSYNTSVEKKVAQITSEDKEKKAFDLDINQRVADYVINTQINRGNVGSETDTETKDTIHLRDTLPKGLTYIPNSSYWGGEYQQAGEGVQGTVLNGQKLPDPAITANEDGTTVLEWVIPDITVTSQKVTSMPPLYYSCDIGTPGSEETDVGNGDVLLNTVEVWCEQEQRRPFSEANRNLSTCSIQVTKNKAVSISKIPDQAVVEPQEPMGFVLNVGNNGNTPMEVISIDSLPYNGDKAGSMFHGPLYVSEISITAKNPQDLGKLLNDNFRLYYTLEESLRGKGSQDFTLEDFSGPQWQELQADPATGAVTIPSEPFAPVAVAAVGELPGNKTLAAHITLELPEGKPGDYIANRLTRGDMEAHARSSIVSRTLEGLVWEDENANGIRAYSEPLFSQATAQLMVLRDQGDPQNRGDYEPYVSAGGDPVIVPTGKQLDLLDPGNPTVYDAGCYKFLNLPEGTFGVLFTNNGSMDEYTVSPRNQGTDDQLDSDAAAVYSDDDILQEAFIPGIVMPPKEEIHTIVYSSRHNDLGIYPPVSFRFTKVAAEETSTPLEGAQFSLYQITTADPNELLNLEDPQGFQLVGTAETQADGLVTFSGLRSGTYRLVETRAPEGRLLPVGQWNLTLDRGYLLGLPQAVGSKLPPAFINDDGALKLPNMKPMDIPHSGGPGTVVFGLASALLIGLGGAILLYGISGKRRRS